LIPARNEEQNIIRLLESIDKQDYPHFEAIVLDDNSSDNTYQLCADYAERHPKFSVIKGKDLPSGWLGKNFACHQLAGQANGKYLLYIDADETVTNGLLNSAVHRMHLHKLGLLSLFANQQMLTLSEKLVVPLMHYMLLNLLPLRLVYLVKYPSLAAASGQFMLFDAQVYRNYEWHRLVKHKVVEDIEIIKLMKVASIRVESLLANNLINCRMYSNYPDAIKGFSKNFLAIFNFNVIGFLVYLLIIIGGPMLVLMTLNMPLIMMMAGLIVLSRVMISLLSGQNVWQNILYHPVQMFNLAVISILAVHQHITKTIVWKGRKI
jgi:chlorobactene glucosyltransferase